MGKTQWLSLTNPGGLDERSRIPNQLWLEAENLGLAHDGFLVQRPGVGAEDLTGSGFNGPIQWLGRFVTTTGSQELWAAAENAGSVAALARRVGSAWGAVTFSDTVSVLNLRHIHAASLNSKYFLAYDSDVNRLHVWDGTSLRRVGITKPAAAPTVANTGAGAYAADARRYRVQFLIVSGSDIQAASELSDASSVFTPSGAGTAARVTRPTTPDSATHWRVYGIAGSDDTYSGYELLSGNIAVATTTYDDSVAPASYSGEAPALLGTNIPPPSAKSIVSDGTRLVMLGSHEASATSDQTAISQTRVWYTRVLGSSDLGDDESIPNTIDQQNWINIGDIGPLIALTEPIGGDIYVFGQFAHGKLSPTGDNTAPYRWSKLGDGGAVSQRVVTTGKYQGQACAFIAEQSRLNVLAGGGLADMSVAIERDLRGANFSAEHSVIGFDPASNQLVVNVNTSAPTRDGAYYQFTNDTKSGRWCGMSLGGSLSGWILGASNLGITTVLGDSGAYIRATAPGVATDGQTKLFLGGADTNGDPALVSWGTALGADNAEPFVSRVRWRGVIAAGAMAAIGQPTVIFRNPIGSLATTATLTLSYIRQDGEVRSQSIALDASDENSSLGIKELTFEGLESADVQSLDIRAEWSYSAGFTGDVWPGIDAIQIPFTIQEGLAR